MTSAARGRRTKAALGLALAAAGAALCIGLVAALASRSVSPPSRCGPGFVPLGPRCCGEGQRLEDGLCRGAPSACGPDHERRPDGCVPRGLVERFGAGSVTLGPSDWEAQGVVEPREVRAGPFSLDRFECHVGRYLACLGEGRCPGPAPRGDVGQAAVLDFEQASALCAASGGRLPTDDEWTLAAMGARGRRYPWGDTGAVCRRAAFGLVDGPCASGALGPDTAGAHPDGRSPEGLLDLAGNVAEWTLAADGGRRLRGGSYASSFASELRGWRADGAPGPSPRAGARCAYDVVR